MIKYLTLFLFLLPIKAISQEILFEQDGAIKRIELSQTIVHYCYDKATFLPNSVGIKEDTYFIVPSWLNNTIITSVLFLTNEIATSGTDYVVRLTVLHDSSETTTDNVTFSANGALFEEINNQNIEIKEGDKIRIEVVTSGTAIPKGLFYFLQLKY